MIGALRQVDFRGVEIELEGAIWWRYSALGWAQETTKAGAVEAAGLREQMSLVEVGCGGRI